jgi:hypothetical protein
VLATDYADGTNCVSRAAASQPCAEVRTAAAAAGRELLSADCADFRGFAEGAWRRGRQFICENLRNLRTKKG